MKNVGVIGLGVVGCRTSVIMESSDRIRAVCGFDPSPENRAAAQIALPNMIICDTAEKIIQNPEVDVIYIACPPAHHKTYVEQCIAAGKAIWCEKPLGIDIAESQELVNRVETSSLLATVNFIQASSAALNVLQNDVNAGTLGALHGIDLSIHFSKWPREFQASADWLRYREEGGFIREVISHFLFVTQRLIGPITLDWSKPSYPDDPTLCETAIQARLINADNVPLTITNTSGGASPDSVRYVLRGSNKSYEIRDWFTLLESDGGPWNPCFPESTDDRMDALSAQPEAIADMLEGKSHNLSTFREALQVQTIVENML